MSGATAGSVEWCWYDDKELANNVVMEFEISGLVCFSNCGPNKEIELSDYRGYALKVGMYQEYPGQPSLRTVIFEYEDKWRDLESQIKVGNWYKDMVDNNYGLLSDLKTSVILALGE
jgi:hypothetical protein